MKFLSSILVTSGLLAATEWIPTGESFRTITFSSRHKINSENSEPFAIIGNDTNNSNRNRSTIRRNMVSNKKSNNNDDMLAAQEAEARKICPLLPPPADVHSTFEAAMG